MTNEPELNEWGFPYGPDIPEPYPFGTILRYDWGPTALMFVTSHHENHGRVGDTRYWGVHVLGGSHGAYGFACKTASKEEWDHWRKGKPDPEPNTVASEDDL